MDTRAELAQAIRDHSGMDDEQLREAGKHGADAGWPGFTYMSDAVEFFDANANAIWQLLVEEADELGVNVAALIAEFRRADMADSWGGFRNLLAWFALEEVGRWLDEENER